MPLITVTLARSASTKWKGDLLDAIHAALISIGVPSTDRFQRVFELDPNDFRFDLNYPDLTRSRDDGFVLIEVLWATGRSVKVKRQFLADLMQRLKPLSIDSEQVMVVFKETGWENWSFGGGRLIHA